MIGNLSVIKHEKIEGHELTVGDVLGYQDGNYERYFVVRGIDLNRGNNELRIQEVASSYYYETSPSARGNISKYGDAFNYDLVSTRRNFTRVLPNDEKMVKTPLCKVLIAAMFATDELRNLLVELEI